VRARRTFHRLGSRAAAHAYYQASPEIYAAGIAAQVPVPWQTAVPIGIPKTGFPTESMAKVAAATSVRRSRDSRPSATRTSGDSAAVCMMDAGSNGVKILADHILCVPRIPSVAVSSRVALPAVRP